MIVEIGEIVWKLKYGGDEELRGTVNELGVLVEERRADGDWISEEGVVSVLVDRMAAREGGIERVEIIRLLRCIVREFDHCKELMGDVTSLTTLIKSLARDAAERREAVGLLLDLCHLSVVRRRIGRIKGCILMLVTLMNGDDPLASSDAGKILNTISKNVQNAIYMAEAGYFVPLVQHLKEGSEMSKIFTATALSKMVLSEQSRASLGENGSVEPLIIMFKIGKLEAKISALNALKNLSLSANLVPVMLSSGILSPLLQLLFSVTSSLTSLHEPAAALLAKVAQSEPSQISKDVASQMLSLLSLSSPLIRCNLLQAVHSIASHPSSSKVRSNMKKNGVVQLLLPFLTDSDVKVRVATLNLLDTITKELTEDLEQEYLIGEDYTRMIVRIVSTSVLEAEKAAGLSLISGIPVGDKQMTNVLKGANLLPILVSELSSSCNSTPLKSSMSEAIASITMRFTDPSDKKTQRYAVELGVIPLLVKILSEGSGTAKLRAATSLAQLSQNSPFLRRSNVSRWTCISPSREAFCEVHGDYCTVKGNFCLIKAGAIPPLILALQGKEKEADEAVLNCIATLLLDGLSENGSNFLAKMDGVEAIISILESGTTTKAKEKALWILERLFHVQAHRLKYGASAQVLLIDLAQTGDPCLKPMVARILAQLELLQVQSSYF
ncbi:U-box domain-containing protein [Drosera capensis]